MNDSNAVLPAVRSDSDLALKRLNALGAFFAAVSGDSPARRRLPPRLGPQRGRGTRSRLEQGSVRTSVDLRTLGEVTLVRTVSILEAFVIDLGEDLFLLRLAGADAVPGLRPLADYLFHEQWDRIAKQGGWDQALEVWKGGLGVNPRTFEEWQEVDLLRTTRHSIVHRLGEVTDKYRNNSLAKRRLEALGLNPATVSGLIPLGKKDVQEGLELSRRFVRWLDEKLQ